MNARLYVFDQWVNQGAHLPLLSISEMVKCPDPQAMWIQLGIKYSDENRWQAVSIIQVR